MRGAVPDQCRTGRQVLYASRQKVDEYITDAFRGAFVLASSHAGIAACVTHRCALVRCRL
jgi:hypothetical protein